jgi:hypothetical protein
VQRYSAYNDLLTGQAYTLQAIGLICLYGACMWTTSTSLKAQHQISPVVSLSLLIAKARQSLK